MKMPFIAERPALAVIGGASGVGKTTLVERCGLKTINTGDLFKRNMTQLLSRDDIPKSDWTAFEKDVANELSAAIVEQMCSSRLAVIDTHFAARLRNADYRIGLQRNLLFALGRDVFSYADQAGEKITIVVILISCDPHSLLRRRRQDSTRNRDLVPSDCVNALRGNKAYSLQYHAEFLRARSKTVWAREHGVYYHVLENQDLHQAINELSDIFGNEE